MTSATIIDVETLCREYFYESCGAFKDPQVNLDGLHLTVKGVYWRQETSGQSKPYTRKVSVIYAGQHMDTQSELIVTKINKKERKLKINNILVRGLKDLGKVDISLEGLPREVRSIFRDTMTINIGQSVNVLATVDSAGDVQVQARNTNKNVNAEIIDQPNHCFAIFNCTLELTGTVSCTSNGFYEQSIQEIFRQRTNMTNLSQSVSFNAVTLPMTGTCSFNWASAPVINWR